MRGRVDREMQRTESWGEWSRKVFERAFLWFLACVGIAFLASLFLGDVSLFYIVRYVVPACALAFGIHVSLLWRRRPKP